MRNARDAETELRQQLANLELEYSEQSGQVAALMERVRRQEEVASASTYGAALAPEYHTAHSHTCTRQQ